MPIDDAKRLRSPAIHINPIGGQRRRGAASTPAPPRQRLARGGRDAGCGSRLRAGWPRVDALGIDAVRFGGRGPRVIGVRTMTLGSFSCSCRRRLPDVPRRVEEDVDLLGDRRNITRSGAGTIDHARVAPQSAASA